MQNYFPKPAITKKLLERLPTSVTTIIDGAARDDLVRSRDRVCY